nr:MAG TPA: hypothetical protein [Caudoviricetes sp.]
MAALGKNIAGQTLRRPGARAGRALELKWRMSAPF